MSQTEQQPLPTLEYCGASQGEPPMDSPPTLQFHPECDHCTTGHGAARSVTIDHRDRTISYVCDTCLHTWTITDLVAPIPSFGFDADAMTV